MPILSNAGVKSSEGLEHFFHFAEKPTVWPRKDGLTWPMVVSGGTRVTGAMREVYLHRGGCA